jgi:hypothetical protein
MFRSNLLTIFQICETNQKERFVHRNFSEIKSDARLIDILAISELYSGYRFIYASNKYLGEPKL